MGVPVKRVAAAIIVEEGKVLLTRRAPGERLAGMWEFPGGKLEAGESAEECLRRELHEELSIHASTHGVLVRSVYAYDDGAIELIAVATVIESGELRLTVHDRAEWVPLDALLEYDLAPADIPIAKYLIESDSLDSGDRSW